MSLLTQRSGLSLFQYDLRDGVFACVGQRNVGSSSACRNKQLLYLTVKYQ